MVGVEASGKVSAHTIVCVVSTSFLFNGAMIWRKGRIVGGIGVSALELIAPSNSFKGVVRLYAHRPVLSARYKIAGVLGAEVGL